MLKMQPVTIVFSQLALAKQIFRKARINRQAATSAPHYTGRTSSALDRSRVLWLWLDFCLRGLRPR